MKVHKASDFRLNVTISERAFNDNASGPIDKEASLTVTTKGKVKTKTFRDSLVAGGEYRGRKHEIIVPYQKRLLGIKDATLVYNGTTATISELPLRW